MGLSSSTPYKVYEIHSESPTTPLVVNPVRDPAKQGEYEQIIRNIVAMEQEHWINYKPPHLHAAYQIMIVSVNESNHRGRMQ